MLRTPSQTEAEQHVAYPILASPDAITHGTVPFTQEPRGNCYCDTDCMHSFFNSRYIRQILLYTAPGTPHHVTCFLVLNRQIALQLALPNTLITVRMRLVVYQMRLPERAGSLTRDN